MIRISTDSTCHVEDHKAIYGKRFINVMNYHEGIAAVRDESGAYHIDIEGNPIYEKRFVRTFGFYEGLAAVVDGSGAYHIDAAGNPAYIERFLWAGNFQEGRCPVRTKDGSYSSIDRSGIPHLTGAGYIGDYSEGKVIVRGPKGCTYADTESLPGNPVWYTDCTNYCNGLAYVSEGAGFRPADKCDDTAERQYFSRIVRFDKERLTAVDYEDYLVDMGRKVVRIGACDRTEKPLPGWVDFVEKGNWDSCAVFLRHGDRSASAQSDGHTVESKPLTEKGIRRGQEIWEHVSHSEYDSLIAYSSPVERCVRSAELITGGTVHITVTEVLGLPGTAFICDNRASDKTDRLPLMQFAISHLTGSECPGWYPVPVAAENILTFLSDDLSVNGRLTFCSSHDAFLARLVGIFMQEYPTDRWFGFYDGIAIFRKDGKLYAMYAGKTVGIPADLHSVRVELTSSRDSVTEWIGEPHEGIRTFRSKDGKYGFLTEQGFPLTSERFDYADEMKYSMTVVGLEGKGFTYLTDLGQYPIDKWFVECTPFHKGYATARDERGWYHIDLSGNPIYKERYAYAEPFYNEVALCRDVEGNWYLVRQDGGSEIIIRGGSSE